MALIDGRPIDKCVRRSGHRVVLIYNIHNYEVESGRGVGPGSFVHVEIS